MKKISLRNLEIIGAVFGILFGTMLHFTYEWSGSNFFVGMFSAVNESVWEHTKLLFVPIMVFLVVEWFFVEKKHKLLFAKAAEIVLTSIFIISFFYTYTGALGIESLLVDIASFIVAVIFGKFLSYSIIKSDYTPKLSAYVYALLLVGLFGTYIMLTLYPPKIPLFMDPETKTYGIWESK